MESGEEDEASQDLPQGTGHGESGGSDGDGDAGATEPRQWTRDTSVEDLNNHCQDRHLVDQVGIGLQSAAQDTDGNEELKEQLANVEAMVQEMKVSFMGALEQLSSLQDGGDTTNNSTTNSSNNTAAWQKMDSRCQRQDQQMSDLAKSIDILRKEVTVLSDNVNQVVSTQQSLQNQVATLQSGQQLLLQELVSAGILSNDKSREVFNKCQLALQEGRFPANASRPRSQSVAKVTTETAQGSQDQDKTDVTAAACKSLSLTQALASHCQDIDVSDSSEEDITSSRNSRQQRVDHHGQSLSLNAATETPERRQAMQDIVDSEQEYCSQLWTVIHAYQQPLQDGHYMSSRQLCVLFPSPLDDLYQHHSHMLQSLQDRLAHASYASAVGDVFARLTDSNSNLLGLYQEYVESLPGAISCLRRQMSQARSFRSFVKEQRDSNPNSDLLTLLISPLQRIPKYMLQLQQVLRHTGENHPDYFHLQASLGRLQDFVERFNHDITHTTQAITLDLQHIQGQGLSFRSSASNSSCEMLAPTTSTIDSGIQSTGEEAFLHSGRTHHDGYKWHTDPRQQAMRLHPGLQQQQHQHQQRQARRSREWRLAARSQPDLTHGGYLMPSNMVDPHTATTVPHLRPYMAAAASGDHSARHRRFKIKKRVEGQGGYTTNNPPLMRPASAMDFAAVDRREDGEQQRQALRPHSVLGPFPGDGRSRVIQVHGRNKPRAAQRLNYTAHPAHVRVNGHWDPAAGGDPMGNQGMDHAGGQYYREVVDYEDEEDDTRALSDAPSTSSQKASSSRHSHDLPGESETDNSDDFSQEDLAAALSHHLNNGAGAGGGSGGGGHPPHHTVNAHDLQMNHHRQMYSSPRPSQQIVQHYQQDDEDDDQLDVHLDSTESDLTPSMLQTLKPPEDMSEELKLDLTCFHDDDIKPTSLLKRQSQPVPDPPKVLESQGPLSMKPLEVGSGGGSNGAGQTADIVPQPADRSQTEPSKEVVSSLSSDKMVTSLPPIHPQDSALPSVTDTNGRMLHAELDHSPVRRSVTPSEFSNVPHPAVLRRVATPSEYLGGTADPVSSKGGRRRKDLKNSSSEALHRSVDDVSLSTSKKKPFRTSLKNLFQRKKHTESDV